MIGQSDRPKGSDVAKDATISCIICAYNEGDRIGRVLRAVSGHPLLSEIIVVDDGSTDLTAQRVREFPNVRLLQIWPNGGKTNALATGIAAATGTYVMLLDADLAGLTRPDVFELAAPVLRGEAESSISLRGDTLGIYRTLGIDFVSGERVLPRSLFGNPMQSMAELPRWGCEVFINERIIEEKLRVAVVDWRDVFHTPKSEKVGSKWQGAKQEWKMIQDALRVLSPFGVIRQHWGLMKLAGVFFFKLLRPQPAFGTR